MSDQSSPLPEGKPSKFDELNQLVLEVIKSKQVTLSELHQVVINAWHVSIDAESQNPTHKVIIKNGARIFNMLYRTIDMYHYLRAFVLQHRPDWAKSTKFPVQPFNLNIRFSPWHTVADIEEPLSIPDEIEWLFTGSNTEIELQQYPPDELKWIGLVAQSWYYLYEQLIQARKNKEYTDARLKGRDYYIDKVLESEDPHVIKTLLQAGRCLGCGDKLQPQNYSSDRYCSKRCSKRLDQFFKDLMAKNKIKKHPVEATIDQAVNILRERYNVRRCKICDRELTPENSKGDNVRCKDCIKLRRAYKDTKKRSI